MISSTQKILVVGPAWVGDMVMAQSLFKTLKEQAPDSHIDVLAPDWSLPILQRMPEVRQAFQVQVGHGQLRLSTRLDLGKGLRSEKYSQAIVLPRSWKSALLPFWAKIPVRTGFRGEFRHFLLNDIRRLDPHVLGTTVERFTALGLSPEAAMPPKIHYPQLTADSARGLSLLKKYGLDSKQPLAGFMPGAAFGPAKQWPTSHFAQLARYLHAEGWQICIFGSPKDAPAAEHIRDLCAYKAVNLCGRTSLAEAIDLIAQVRVAVSNDSGLMHIAAAVGTRIVSIFGSSSPAYTPPLTAKAKIQATEIECRPCFERRCRFGHYRCLTEIDPGKVLSDIHALCGT
jgi:heptosyltransferase-2